MKDSYPATSDENRLLLNRVGRLPNGYYRMLNSNAYITLLQDHTYLKLK